MKALKAVFLAATIDMQPTQGGGAERPKLHRKVKGEPAGTPLSLLTEVPAPSTLKVMEVHFTPEQEAQLSRIASRSGADTEQLVKDAALRLVEEDRHFRAGVRRGIEEADRGELINHDYVKARIEGLLQP